MKNNQCIRALADIDQINACRAKLKEMESPISDLSAAMNLAGNEARMKMLYVIGKEGKLCVCDLSDILGLSIAAVSQHLRKMKDGGLLENEKEGQTIFYSLNSEKVHVLKPLFQQIDSSELVK
jgi:ArsR family transcriptional regulator, lead/cadmium/zinc/bismuth-responsive transcriptional repressor